MIQAADFAQNTADDRQIAAHLRACDSSFALPLSLRTDIDDYARKLVCHADRFEAWADGLLVGLLAVYCNAPDRQTAFVSSVSTLPAWRGRGIASRLLANCLNHVRNLGFADIELEIGKGDTRAENLYRRHNFVALKVEGPTARMRLDLNKGAEMNPPRDYNAEIRDTTDHRYAYGFDLDVMHPCMVRSFQPHFRPGSLLELGSYQGDLTRRFLDHFDDITCVEASDIAIREARQRLGDRVDYINARFEQVTLPRRYDNIILTHVLEHLDDPVSVLRRINDEWLTQGGHLFLVCPNANAPSRQIAVKMGLISHNTAVTPAEAEHGHRRTYTLDTLERDAVAAGLNVVQRTGIFFKALANFQWDRLLGTDIISPEYLEGCYQLGQVYPDLCSSIFLLCEPGAHRD